MSAARVGALTLVAVLPLPMLITAACAVVALAMRASRTELQFTLLALPVVVAQAGARASWVALAVDTGWAALLDAAVVALVTWIAMALAPNAFTLGIAVICTSLNRAILATPVAAADTQSLLVAHSIARALVGAFTLPAILTTVPWVASANISLADTQMVAVVQAADRLVTGKPCIPGITEASPFVAIPVSTARLRTLGLRLDLRARERAG